MLMPSTNAATFEIFRQYGPGSFSAWLESLTIPKNANSLEGVKTKYRAINYPPPPPPFPNEQCVCEIIAFQVGEQCRYCSVRGSYI